jgi:hypothetical protein
MIAVIPFKNFSSFTEEITFTDNIFILDFNWNSRAQAWKLSIYDRDNTPILQGRRLVLFQSILSQFVDIGLNNIDNLMVIDKSDNTPNIQYNDLINGSRELIFYNE